MVATISPDDPEDVVGAQLDRLGLGCKAEQREILGASVQIDNDFDDQDDQEEEVNSFKSFSSEENEISDRQIDQKVE